MLTYRILVVAPGIRLDWEKIDGLTETLGNNGVTSNYRYDLAPYTWELVQKLEAGRALFTPAAHADQVRGRAAEGDVSVLRRVAASAACSSDIDVEFHNAGAVLFGVKEYVPALMEYVEQLRHRPQASVQR